MSLFSFLRKNKQEATPGDGEFYSRAEDESQVVRSRGKRKTKQSEEPADPVLPEKKRARRRLIGAIALVLAAIIGLPMILDSEPKPLADDITIQIPSKDKSAPSTMQRRPAAAPSVLPVSAGLDQAEQIVESAPIANKRTDAAVAAVTEMPAVDRNNAKSAPSTEATKPKIAELTAKDENKPEQNHLKTEPKKTESKNAAKTETRDTALREQQGADAARAKAILEGKSDVKADAGKPVAEKKSGKFAVQVAALATQEKINELRGKLNAAGIQSYTQKVATKSGERTRIRVGPFASKEEAEKVRGKLVKMGLNGTLVPPSSS